MEKNKQNKEFTSLEFPFMELKGKECHNYAVYQTEDNFIIVEAPSAYDAIQKSQIKNPFKVVRKVAAIHNVMHQQQLMLPQNNPE